jgi:hypothetical protein
MKYQPEDISKFEEKWHNEWCDRTETMDISDVKSFLITEKKEAYEAGRREGAEDYKQFILNVLAGIDIADGKCNTKAIRHAIESKIINKLKQTQ